MNTGKFWTHVVSKKGRDTFFYFKVQMKNKNL